VWSSPESLRMPSSRPFRVLVRFPPIQAVSEGVVAGRVTIEVIGVITMPEAQNPGSDVFWKALLGLDGRPEAAGSGLNR